MAQTKNSMSKLVRLTTLRDSLLDCCKESVKNADEWQTFHDMLAKVVDMISDEHRRLGYMAVYPIVNGSAQEALFEGTREQCKIYTDILLENKPEMKGNIIGITTAVIPIKYFLDFIHSIPCNTTNNMTKLDNIAFSGMNPSPRRAKLSTL